MMSELLKWVTENAIAISMVAAVLGLFVPILIYFEARRLLKRIADSNQLNYEHDSREVFKSIVLSAADDLRRAVELDEEKILQKAEKVDSASATSRNSGDAPKVPVDVDESTEEIAAKLKDAAARIRLAESNLELRVGTITGAISHEAADDLVILKSKPKRTYSGHTVHVLAGHGDEQSKQRRVRAKGFRTIASRHPSKVRERS